MNIIETDHGKIIRHPIARTNLAQAYIALGDQKLAQEHLEKAMELDYLNLNAATLLMKIYDKNGERTKSDELSKRLAKFVSP
jgi:Tfp pilus assembly protein PilF